MRIVALVTEDAQVRRILEYVGEPPMPPALSPSRAPPQEEFIWDQGAADDFDQRTQFTDEPW